MQKYASSSTSDCQSKILVLAMGNPLRGDDGIGAAIIKTLSVCERLPQGVTLMDGYVGGLMNALLNREYKRVIIVDAAMMGCIPGEWRRFKLEDARLESIDLHSVQTLHNASLAEVISLARVLRYELPEIIVYGIQPQEIDWSTGLSQPIRVIIPQVCNAILEELSVFY